MDDMRRELSHGGERVQHRLRETKDDGVSAGPAHAMVDPGWAARVRLGAVRWARASHRYPETVAFYRDLVGLPVIGEFTSSFGEDGTIFALPDATMHMEIVRAHPGSAPPGAFDQLVLYLEDDGAVAAATAPLREAGFSPDPAAHPYWTANGATTYRDPDGRGVVFAPWVYGRVPDPVDRPSSSDQPEVVVPAPPPLRIDWHDGDRRVLRTLFEEAEDSRVQLDGYIDLGRVLVARVGDRVVGHLQLVDAGKERESEVKNMAVVPDLRGTGIGRRLLEAATTASRDAGYTQLVVATAAADVDNLRFYQRCGFRFSSVERDAFGADAGYPDGLMIDGIALRDRVWFTLPL